MRRFIQIFVILALGALSHNALANSNKQTLCHKGDKTISVASAAVKAHINHGDTRGACRDRPEPPDEEYSKAVVMLRCEPQAGNGVLVVSSSSSPALRIAPRDDCAEVLEGLLNDDFVIRSITSGSAEAGGTLRLYTDYLLLGKVELVPEPR